jgi:ParB family chromosome partitioning protein
MSKKASKGNSGGAVPKQKPAPPPARSLDFSGLDLGALEEETVAREKGEPLRVPINEVYEDDDNPRTEFDEDEINELAADMRVRNVLQPIVTWPRDERGYKIRYGAKRRRAAERAGLPDVPIAVYAPASHLDDYAQVSENRKRSDLSPMDLARFIRRKMKQDGHSAAEVARRLEIDKGTVTHHLALLEQPEPILALYRNRRCTSAKNLWELGNLYRDHPAEVEAFLRSDEEEVTRTSIRQLAARLNGQREAAAAGAAAAPGGPEGVGRSNGAPPVDRPQESGGSDARAEAAGAKQPADPNVQALVSRMQDHFGTKVNLQHNPKTGKGTVTFAFFSLEQLQGLLERWRFPQE